MSRNNRKKPELLMPAGSLPVLKAAVIYGADAVYLGGEAFSLRANARNFTLEEMKEGISFAHAHGVKVYITANIIAHNQDLTEAEAYFHELSSESADALIISDPGIFLLAKKMLPEKDLHISTQANTTNYAAYRFWHDLGASRVVGARELSLSELSQIRRQIPEDMEMETFVHGSMCISYSGRCLLSAFLTGRSGNQGDCTHPCRWNYHLMEETRPGQYFPVEENERGTFLFNSKDLCMIEHLPELLEAGIDSLKVEGRMKSALYVATVARAYCMALNDLLEDPAKYRARLPFYQEEISKCTCRNYTTGFFFGKPDASAQIYDASTYHKEWTYLGMIDEDQTAAVAENGRERICYRLEQKNKFCTGETIEIMKPDGTNLQAKVEKLFSEDLQPIDSCPHPRQIFYADFGMPLKTFDMIRIRRD